MTRTTPAATTRRARLLVALNSTAETDRAAVCAASLCGDWLERLGRGSPRSDRRIPPPVLERARGRLRRFEAIADREARLARDAGAAIVTRVDPGYPSALLDLPLPPPVLYCRGEIPDGPAIAVVGSRAADSYGLETATMFCRYLAASGVVVVSGLALGIDSAAHRGALEASGGRTIAVLGCGVDVEYPRGSARLAERIAGSGAVISEFPIGTRPLKANFPTRNRILAALATGTLVVRATARSGSLITARLALELGRDVYALPGNIFDRGSIGPNSLIRDGALAVQHPREMIESLPLAVREQLESTAPDGAPAPEPAATDLDRPLRQILDRLSPGEARTAETLSDLTGKPLPTVLSALLELELGGWVRRYPGPTFCRRG